MSRAKNDIDRRRSENMRAIRSHGNRTTEMRLKAMLVRHAIDGWKLCPKNIPGNPDFFFPKEKVVIFVDGCFWHGCPRCGHIPRTNGTYWAAKIARNRRRDRSVMRILKSLGYRVIRIWECHLRTNPKRCLYRVLHRVRTVK